MPSHQTTPAPQDEAIDWHRRDAAEVARALSTTPQAGLTATEAAERLAAHGENRLAEARTRSPLRMVIDQFTDVMVLVLAAAAVVAGMVGEPQDTIAIVAILLLNATLGFVQEYRAERAMSALRALAAPTARVRREGHVHVLPAAHLVPGDVVLLEAGVIVPADLRLLDTPSLRLDESALTGESHAIDKASAALLGDRVNMAYKGTVVTYGRGEGLVVATGMRTELGRIASLLDEATDTQTPMQRRLKRFASQLAAGVIVLCVVIFGIGLVRGEPPLLMFLTALSLAVAAMPEALPAVVTVSLALGARRMVARRALVRRLPAVETLGSVTYICSDKTGTLTQNRMQVAEVDQHAAAGAAGAGDANPAAGAATGQLLRALALNTDATIGAEGAADGEPTEVALLEYARGQGGDVARLQREYPRVGELPFSSERGRMTTLHATPGGGQILVMKGAPERMVPCCTHALRGDARMPFDEGDAHRQARAMAAAGLRVLAVAERDASDADPAMLGEADERGMTWLGLVGLLDPLRPEAAAAVKECESAGIAVVMITGDHPATATAIARQLGIANDRGEQAVAGDALAEMDDDALRERVGQLRVYARVAPEQKIRIVRALQGRGEFVAMTGDGVNDAPALQQADIGIAMGKAGTDVAREAADMVLVDDNFASIVAAVREGRRIYDNIRKFIKYTLTSNSGEIWLLFLAPFLGLPVPLLPIHILWINLVTDGLPGLALAIEPEERGLMQRPPRPPRESIFAHGLWQHTVWVGLLMGGVSLGTQGWAIASGSSHWQSMVFTVLSLSQLGHALAVRSERDSLVTLGLRSNLPLTLAVAGTVLLQMATLYVPAMNTIFKTEPLSPGELLACLGLSCVTFLAVEGEKACVRRGWLYGERAVVQ